MVCMQPLLKESLSRHWSCLLLSQGLLNSDLHHFVLIPVTEAEVIVPPGLEVKPSNIPQAGLGVFAKCIILKHEFFGPYIGRIVSAEQAARYRDSPHVWEVCNVFHDLESFLN